jgi:hypothetical protein
VLQQLVAGEALPPLRLAAPALADLPNGPGSTLGCLRLAVLLVTDQHGRYVVMIQAPNEHQPSLQIEVAGLPVGLAQRLLAELDGAVTDLARALLPAIVVLEDVDLVAEERSLGPASSPVLFDLLDAMDGAAPDADLLFLLTTNRADLLEPALAARPGRVDVAVEIALPDAPARGRLLTLYGENVPLALTEVDVNIAVERTDGTTASFLKELIRRSVLESLHDDPALTAVTGEHLARALDDLLDAAQAVTRTLLGVGVDPADLPAGGALTPGPGRAGPMMYARRGMMVRRVGPYGG